MAQKRQICEKCGRNLPVESHTAFWRKRTGGYATVCKECMTKGKDPRDEQQFLPLLKELDFPYVEKTWVLQFNRAYKQNPDNVDVIKFFGRYLRSLNLASSTGAGKGFDATEELNKLPDSKASKSMYTSDDIGQIIKEEAEELAAMRLKEEKKKAKEAAKETAQEEPPKRKRGRPPKEKTEKAEEAQPANVLTPQTPPAYIATLGIDEENIANELTDEDKKYLALKWGMLYKPSEWVTLEDKYQKYAAEYEMNVDREEVLRSICKTNLKMDQALDVCDFKAYKDLSMVYDQLRKSGKFTESQNKEQAKRDIDSIGELVSFVESEGGIIPHFESPIEYPKDRIDFIIKDLKNYTVNLVKNELGLGDLIESFIEKVKENKTKSVEEMVEEGFTSVSDDLRAEAEARDYQRNQMSELEEESMRLVEEYGA